VGEKFDPDRWQRFEDPERLEELPPAVIAELLQLAGDETLVDYGAGTGMYTIALAQWLPHGSVIAVDDSAEMLEHLCEKLEAPQHEGLRERINVVHSEHDRVPLPDGCAQRLMAINVLHHIHDEPQPLAEIVRLLAPGGLCVVIEFGAIDRPFGPAKDHVLPHDQLRAVAAGLGLAVVAFHAPGEPLPWHVAVVAQKLPA
jgi:ubiquinone/menaquinone biosynthesis C-methylase UbiE